MSFSHWSEEATASTKRTSLRVFEVYATYSLRVAFLSNYRELLCYSRHQLVRDYLICLYLTDIILEKTKFYYSKKRKKC